MDEYKQAFEHEEWYNVRAASAKFVESSGNSPGIAITWEVTEGPLTGEPLYDEHWLTTNTIERQVKDFGVLGVDIRTLDLNLLNQTIKGREASVFVKIEEFPENSGKFKAKVGRIKQKGAGGPGPLVKKIADLLKNENTKEPPPETVPF